MQEAAYPAKRSNSKNKQTVFNNTFYGMNLEKPAYSRQHIFGNIPGNNKPVHLQQMCMLILHIQVTESGKMPVEDIGRIKRA